MKNVVIYTTPTCGYCKMTKAWFKENNVTYTEQDVTLDEAAQKAMIEKSGQMGVPVIDIDGQILVGYQPDKLKQLLGLWTRSRWRL